MTSLDTGLVHQTVEISMTLRRKTPSCTEECQGVQSYPKDNLSGPFQMICLKGSLACGLLPGSNYTEE